MDKKGWNTPFVPEHFKGMKLRYDLVNAETGEVVDVQAEEAPAEAPKPTRRKYLCPQLNEKPVTESECNSCSYRQGCPAHDD